MPILVVTMLLFGNYMKFMPIYDIKKVSSKNIIFWAFCRHDKIKIRCMPIYGHTYIGHNSVIF